ncbi:MAG: hypothetical protein OHK0011_27070 [Turneriella sp.]
MTGCHALSLMKKSSAKTATKTELTPAIRKQIIALSNQKDVSSGLRVILNDYKKYKKVKDKIEAAFKK